MNKEKRFVFLDTETGGLDREHDALLTLGYAITDSLYEIIHGPVEYKLPIKGKVNQEALEINGLNIENRTPDRTLQQIVDEIGDFVQGYDATLYGQNVIDADMNFLRHHDRNAHHKLWYQICQRSFVDTKAHLQFLKDKGYYTGSTSLHIFMENDELHTASGDVILTIEAMKKNDRMYREYYQSERKK